MIKRLPRYAELSFARACAAGDAIPHEPQEDQNGWDYMVEFPQPKHSGHADMQPPAAKAFVQIKSSEGSRLTCRVKLSNALKAAQSREPWFVVLMIAAKGSDDPATYAIHVWQELMERTLRAVRAAEKTGAPLHHQRLAITFNETDRKSEKEFVKWMQGCIDSIEPDYLLQKRALYETIGFDNGHAIGEISFEIDDEEKIYDNFLGLGDGIKLSNFTLTPTRFGIHDDKPQIAVKDATVHITPEAAGDCELRLRGLPYGTMISVPAKVYVLGEPVLSAERRRFRFSGKGIEIVWSLDGYTKFDIGLNFQEAQSLADIENLATLMSWCGSGEIDLQIWTQGARMIGGRLNKKNTTGPTRQFDWQKLIEVAQMLRSLAGKATDANISVSIAEINRSARDVYLMQQFIGAPSLKLEFIPTSEFREGSESVFYYAQVDVGALTAYALVERPVRRFTDIDDGRKSFEFGAARIRDNWVIAGATDKQRAMIVDDYQRLIDDTVKAGGSPPLELGDIGQLYKLSKTFAA